MAHNRHGATLFGILIAAVVAAAPAPGQADWSLATSGKGGLILWPLFGATNQLLAGLAFLVITFHLWRRNKPVWFLILPALFMLVMPMWAMLLQLFLGMAQGKVGWPPVIGSSSGSESPPSLWKCGCLSRP